MICGAADGATPSSLSPFRSSPTAQLVARLGSLPRQDLLNLGLDLLEHSDYHDVPDLKQHIERYLVLFVNEDTLKAVCQEWMVKHADVLVDVQRRAGSGEANEMSVTEGTCR
ncbi:hypothetical protein AMAG_09548 [Allomyces macrogynus ATCC 38327]|uniref:Uncharacterized protein n=1 Tax=Allomyces macrogynus (strain ATCC 38327) TaxID=578462 RepID=A0A0L0ST62_ALLM3|nr:hypothetical protein AMAG_09548 [Allomyces macrogynus ATCC 38327]|eukprot:KNE65570.1 hypothetical protein AMAG_09548 [Allomyces macrogynus ATCC 38327]